MDAGGFDALTRTLTIGWHRRALVVAVGAALAPLLRGADAPAFRGRHLVAARVIATRHDPGSCTIDNADWVAVHHPKRKRTFSGTTLEERPVCSLMWAIAPELNIRLLPV